MSTRRARALASSPRSPRRSRSPSPTVATSLTASLRRHPARAPRTSRSQRFTIAPRGSYAGYSRARFGDGWAPAGEGCDIRDRVLQRDGRDMHTASGCRITARGRARTTGASCASHASWTSITSSRSRTPGARAPTSGPPPPRGLRQRPASTRARRRHSAHQPLKERQRARRMEAPTTRRVVPVRALVDRRQDDLAADRHRRRAPRPARHAAPLLSAPAVGPDGHPLARVGAASPPSAAPPRRRPPLCSAADVRRRRRREVTAPASPSQIPSLPECRDIVRSALGPSSAPRESPDPASLAQQSPLDFELRA